MKGIVKAHEIAFIEYLRKLVGLNPIKNSLQKEGKGNYLFVFEPENGNQLVSSTADLQKGKVLKAQVLYRGYGIVNILITALLVSLILGLCSTTYPFFHLFSSFIPYLGFLIFILYNHNTMLLTHEKIIIRRHLFRPLVLRKEDILQTSVSKNKGHSYRWLLRLLILVALTVQLSQIVENITRNLQMEVAPAFVKLSSILVCFWIVAYILVIYYIFELAAPYQQILKITALSNLNLELYTEEPEEIMAIFKIKNG